MKWGEPAYLTNASRSGSTIRLAWKPKNPGHIAIHLNCNTSLVETLRFIYPDTFNYEGNRAVLIPLNAAVPHTAVEHCALLALTYHRKTLAPQVRNI